MQHLFQKKDKYAPFQTWKVVNLDSDVEPKWTNFSFLDYQEEIMLQSDAFARQSAYPVDQSTNDWFFVNYDYWIQVTFDLISRVIDTAVTELKKSLILHSGVTGSMSNPECRVHT